MSAIKVLIEKKNDLKARADKYEAEIRALEAQASWIRNSLQEIERKMEGLDLAIEILREDEIGDHRERVGRLFDDTPGGDQI